MTKTKIIAGTEILCILLYLVPKQYYFNKRKVIDIIHTNKNGDKLLALHWSKEKKLVNKTFSVD